MQRPAGVCEVARDEPGHDQGGKHEQDVEKAFQRGQPPIYRQVCPYLVAESSPDGGSRRSERPPSALVSSLGITHTLLASPCAI